jgi:hypothetical protein
LTPLDFFAWGFIKDIVYRRKVRALAFLRQRIIEAIELITPHMLINTWQELEYRLDICRATTGAHTEVYSVSYSVHCWKHKFHKAFRY